MQKTSKMREVYSVLSQQVQYHSLCPLNRGRSDDLSGLVILFGAACLSLGVFSLWVSAWVSYGSWFIESVSRAEMGPLF